MTATLQIQHDLQQKRFFAQVDGGLATLSYRQNSDGTLDLYSTVVPSEARGQKVAEQLLQAALGFAKTSNKKVIPTCSYIKAWFDRHPDQKNLLATF